MKRTIHLAIFCFLTLGELFAQGYYKLEVKQEPYIALTEGEVLYNDSMGYKNPDHQHPMGFTFHGRTQVFNTFELQAAKIYILNDTIDFLFLSDWRFANLWTSYSPESEIRMKLVGDAPDRILKVQFHHFTAGPHNSPGSFNYQMWYHEGSNIIEYRMGDVDPETNTMLMEDSINFAIGEVNELQQYADLQCLQGDFTTPTLEDGYEKFMNRMPDSGYVYRLVPKTNTVKELSEVDVQIVVTPKEVKIKTESQAVMEIALVDVNGKIIKNKRITGSQYTMSKQGLPTGVYLLHVKTEKGQVVKKMVL